MLNRIAVGLLLLLTLGCSSNAVMKPSKFQAEPSKDKALVNFVRPSVFMGDGVPHEIWDGETYIGTLNPGNLIQIECEPGEHLFLLDPKNAPWTNLEMTLMPNQVYYIKSNQVPFVGVRMGVAKPNDQRIPTWNSYKVLTIDNEKTQLSDKQIAEAMDYYKDVKSNFVPRHTGK
ncbi:hypothetical protein [Simiduia aestuariiviva]|uniref:DUF2846 domain-containing protein n=1 Tax=Simiduia aestuariiviva TaxID=1510459 RepID=A0A839UQ01_9GAMM|nr:hypothetical protein [Simiduia aestuariiviva]MBB3167896.1 hypothetical protein [Simiduia aestuariiviva]